MGNELSTQAQAEADEAGKRVDEEIRQGAAVETERLLKVYAERKAARKAEEEKRAAEPQQDTTELEPGEVASEPEPIGIPIRSAESSQQANGASDILASFNPRKEKEVITKEPISKPSRPASEEFLGFGNVPPSQDIQSPARKLPRLDTTEKDTTAGKKDFGNSILKTPNDTRPTTAGSGIGSARPTSAVEKPMSAVTKPADRSALPARETARPGSTKRPTNAFDEERRPGLSGLPKVPKRTAIASPQSPDRSEAQRLPNVGSERPPKWYTQIQPPKKRPRDQSGADVTLSSLRTQMNHCKEAGFGKNETMRNKTFESIRAKLHTVIFCEVTGELLKLHRVLHNDDGLPSIFDTNYDRGIDWPFDIKADAKELYNKWARKVFETNILRGIKFATSKKEGQKGGGDSILPEHKVNAQYWGNGDLQNGQWWPLQICALRDGAHGVSQGGIAGKVGDGAYSVIMSGGVNSAGQKYPDEDYGDIVLYCGTDSDNGAPTDYTQKMLDSIGNNPVRLLRSHKLKSDYAPEKGFRYDGLYDVVSVERLDPANSLRQRHRFRLVRQPGQDRIRFSGPEVRPTQQELDEYKKHQRMSGKAKGLE
ncbi:hypothetical protein LTR37_010326 [Vermiconidia calcicola]|uniref:Uncharacterized protein n=1 Tax=Vermiconidia calcicola TaxID=1690605 RepID=A0ACC3N5F4_9PEZI|nr:hypothetical protein LTR37_010326 [Vermiconidia calcicola]